MTVPRGAVQFVVFVSVVVVVAFAAVVVVAVVVVVVPQEFQCFLG